MYKWCLIPPDLQILLFLQLYHLFRIFCSFIKHSENWATLLLHIHVQNSGPTWRVFCIHH